MRIQEIIDAFTLPAGLEALLLGKEVITSDGGLLGIVKKVEIDLSQNKLEMVIIDNYHRPKAVSIDDIQFLNHKIIRLKNGIRLDS